MEKEGKRKKEDFSNLPLSQSPNSPPLLKMQITVALEFGILPDNS
jgi:hypothetical protein